jgi:hypothetical protein
MASVSLWNSTVWTVQIPLLSGLTLGGFLPGVREEVFRGECTYRNEALPGNLFAVEARLGGR